MEAKAATLDMKASILEFFREMLQPSEPEVLEVRQVEEHEMLDGIPSRSRADLADEFRPLLVGEMPVFAQMTLAGTQLAALVNTQIIANGATHVVVVNLPNVANTPDNAAWVSAGAGVYVEPLHPHLTLDMTNAFNNALAAGLGVDTTASVQASTMSQVAWVDAFTASNDQLVHTSTYGLTNLTTPACNLPAATAVPTATAPTPAVTGLTIPGVGFIPLASSLVCTKNTLITDSANVTATDATGVLHYLYADTVHPTPFGYKLLAELVSEKLAIKGWL